MRLFRLQVYSRRCRLVLAAAGMTAVSPVGAMTLFPDRVSALTGLLTALGVASLLFALNSNRRLRRLLKKETHQRISAETALIRNRNELKHQVDYRSDALHQLSFYDPLTKLPNRSLLYERLVHATFERGERTFGLLLIDLNRFKAINDTLGHYIGDAILQEVGIRLQKITGSDTIYYIGGDEFAVMQPSGSEGPSPEALAALVETALEHPFLAKGLPINVGASIGIARYPEHSRDADDLLRFAEIAMYSAKRNQNGSAVYDPSQRQDTKSNLMLASELRNALDHDELLLHYQPKVALDSGEVTGLEALVRWHHPREGLMTAESFVELAEKTGLVRPLTLWILNAVLRQSAAWREAGIETPVAINLSVLNLHDPCLDQQFAELLEDWDLPASAIEIEITESAAIEDPERACEMLGRLRRLGIPIALDDFGTGFSSMMHLKKLPVDAVKIDKSFIKDMLNDRDDAVIVQAIIDLGRSLGLRVVGEGVEDAECWARLGAMNCSDAQGFYISPPIDGAAITEWLQARNPARDGVLQSCPSPA